MRKLIRKWFPDPELERVKQELTHTQSACDHLKAERDELKAVVGAMESLTDAQRKEIDGLNAERDELAHHCKSYESLAKSTVDACEKKIDTLLQSITERDIEIASLNESVGKLKLAVNSAAQFVADELDGDEAAEALVVFCERLEKQSA